jgi:hypothetical protein
MEFNKKIGINLFSIVHYIKICLSVNQHIVVRTEDLTDPTRTASLGTNA